MKFIPLIAFVLFLGGAGCVSRPAQDVVVDRTSISCKLSIDISGTVDNASDYKKATFTYPCDWKNESSATLMKLVVPQTNIELVYPSTVEGDLPMDGVEKPVQIMGQEHVRYITEDSSDAMGPVVRELIRGPVIDTLGTRPYYQYPAGSPVGDQLAGIFASLQLE